MGGPSGFLHGLRSLLRSEQDATNDPYVKWKELEDRRQTIEAVRNPILPTKKEIPFPLVQKKKAKRQAA